jgi:hypothetical protein
MSNFIKTAIPNKLNIINYLTSSFKKFSVPNDEHLENKQKIINNSDPNVIIGQVSNLHNLIVNKYKHTCQYLDKYKQGYVSKKLTFQNLNPHFRIIEGSRDFDLDSVLENMGNIHLDYNLKLLDFFIDKFHIDKTSFQDSDFDYFRCCFESLKQSYPLYELDKYIFDENETVPHHSYFSYGLGINKNICSANRIYMGTNYFSSEFRNIRDRVLQNRGIIDNIVPIKCSEVAGIGYDFSQKIIKTFHFANKYDFPENVLKLTNGKDFHNFTLFSQAFKINSKEVIENRFYFYAKDFKEISAGFKLPYVLMISDRRWENYQYDIVGDNLCEINKKLRSIVNETGKNVIDTFSDIGVYVDTIEYHNKEKFNLYYPTTLNMNL